MQAKRLTQPECYERACLASYIMVDFLDPYIEMFFVIRSDIGKSMMPYLISEAELTPEDLELFFYCESIYCEWLETKNQSKPQDFKKLVA